MRWPWWMTRSGWRGFREGFRAAFSARVQGADREQSLDVAALATYKQLLTDHPDLTWDQFLTTWWKSVGGSRGGHDDGR